MNDLREWKIRYLYMLQDEGCLNGILFDKEEWDECEGHEIVDYDLDRLITIVPDDVIFRQWDMACIEYIEEVCAT